MNRLKELRLSRGLSQQALAQKMQVHQTLISQWENEKTDMVSYSLIALSSFFGVSVDYILGISDDKTIHGNARDKYDNPLDKEFLDAIFQKNGSSVLDDEFTDADKLDILEYIRFKKNRRK